MDLQFYRKVQELSDQLRPAPIALDKSQANTTNLANAYDMNKLMNEPLLASRRSVVRKRRDQAILPCHMPSYMLHPTICWT